MLVANRTGCESNVGRQPKRLFFPPIPEKEKTEEEGTAVASFSIRSCSLLIWDCFLVRLLLNEEFWVLQSEVCEGFDLLRGVVIAMRIF